MKIRKLLLLVVCMFVCMKVMNAQALWLYRAPTGPSPYEQWLDWYYNIWLPKYEAAKRAVQLGYLQDWNENMQRGITRLNTDPQQIGVTPINGALLHIATDISVPQRGSSNLSVTRIYNSKIWYSDSAEADTLGIDRLKAGFWMGEGWDLHFGRYWQSSFDNNGIIFETPAGTKVYFKRSAAKYVATDGSFSTLKNDTMRMSSGEMIIFTDVATMNLSITYTETNPENIWIYSIKKFIDKNGNVTSFFYTPTPYELGNGHDFYGLDSIKTSTNEKVSFHSHQEYVNGVYAFVLLDSIKYKGFNNVDLKTFYHYRYDSTTVSPFGHNFVSDLGDFFMGHQELLYKPTYLLRSVVYPNGDSVYYDYNSYYELTGIHTTGGGVTNYAIKTDSFHIPYSAVFPPQDSAKPMLRLTRGIEKVRFSDSWPTFHTDSIQYKRVFRILPSNRAMSNADSVTIIDPEGNYQVFLFEASFAPPGRADKINWDWDNGVLRERRFHNADGTLLKEIYDGDIQLITADSIAVIFRTRMSDGLKNYETTYREYDDYGNPRLIHECGDVDRNDDDRYIHRQYYSNQDATSWLELSFSGGADYYANLNFYSLVGIDSLIVKRQWWQQGGAPVDSFDTLRYDPPHYQDQASFVLRPYPDNDTLVKVDAWAYYEGNELHVWSSTINLAPIVPVHEDQRFAHLVDARNDYQQKYLHNMIKEEKITGDSAGTDVLSRTCYFYDDTSYIVKTYLTSQSTQWEEPPVPSNLRGNLTRIEQWQGGSDYTKSELRYDQLGNVVRNITHADLNQAETTFIHYDLPAGSPPDKYNYAYPWRVVNHLASSACSLSTRAEYDLHTGLVVRSIDESNADSTLFAYDSLNRFKKVWLPNETQPTKLTKYRDFESPKAVIDSVKLDNTQWLVSKSFFNGFGRMIQAKNFANNRTIVQNFTYNGNGLQDSICNPYEISGTSFSYSSPSWTQITTFQYDGLNRTTQITHPDDENINVKHYANIDTIIDEKGNKTIDIYNAYGAIDTVIDALNNKTCYKYDTLGRLTRVTDAENKITRYYYDKLSRLVAMNGPDAKSVYFYNNDSVDVLYEYDDLGNVNLKKDAKGWVSYTYDDLYRLCQIQHSTNQGSTWSDKVIFIYDSAFASYGQGYNNPRGRLGKMKTVGIDSICYYYDDRSNMTRKVVGIVGLSATKWITYKYNYASLCTLLTSTSGGTYQAKYNYDSLGLIKNITGLVNNLRYTPAGQLRKLVYANNDIDTLEYDNRLRPTHIKAYNRSTLFDYSYTYEDNSNVASIVDNQNNNYTQTFGYDDVNRLTTVTSSAGNQSFSYDDVGNRTSKNMTLYQYYTNTNRLHQDHRGYTYNYDDAGNITSRSDGANYYYDWNSRLIQYAKGTETIDFAYNASGLRVKKYYHTSQPKDEQGEYGAVFTDPEEDLGLKTNDSLSNQTRDIIKVGIRDTLDNYEFTIFMAQVSETEKTKLFITLDIDTIANSGRIRLVEDTLTKVPKKAAWEYCLYVKDEDYGYCDKDGKKISKPQDMTVEKKSGKEGWIKVKVSKKLLNNPSVLRYTIASFDPQIQLPNPNPNTTFQGGSSAADVFPGSNATFAGEINGYGEITESGAILVSDYTLYYVYNGISPIIEYAPGGSMLTKYVYANGRNLIRISGADTSFYHCDALGSPRKMTSEAGMSRWSTRYYPFGEMFTTSGSGNSHTFTGKEFDSEMGLNYFCQRYYDPEIGRFMELDPQGDATSSPYAYCANNPLKFIDLIGLVMQVAVSPDEGGGGDGYDARWWAQYNMMKMVEHLRMTNALRAAEKALKIASNWQGAVEDMLISQTDVNKAVEWIKENIPFLAGVFDMAEIIDIIAANVGDRPAESEWYDENLVTWIIRVDAYQDNADFAIKADLAHEFAEIMWYRANAWTATRLRNFSDFQTKGPGNVFANQWVNRYFIYDPYWGYVGWRWRPRPPL